VLSANRKLSRNEVAKGIGITQSLFVPEQAGSSFLNALVKALERLHIVRAENSRFFGSKYSRWTSGSRLRGASKSVI
jgi:hypothetical protein